MKKNNAVKRPTDKQRLKTLEGAVKVMLPIVKAAFEDNRRAGMLPGRGYDSKAQHLASEQWGWSQRGSFDHWSESVTAAMRKEKDNGKR